MKANIPFYKQPDPKGCMVAVLRMVLEHFGQKCTWKELNDLVERKEEKWANSSPALVKLKKDGWNVKIISTFDYEKFAEEGIEYMYKHYGKKITEEVYLSRYDFETSKKYIKELISLGISEIRKLSFDEIEEYFNQRYMVVVVINSRMINGKKGYMGHVVLITNINNESVWFHDSSFSNPHPNKKIDKKLFIKAHEDKGTDYEVILFKK